MKLLLTTVALFALFNVNTSGAFGASECGKVLLNKGKSNGKAGSTLEGQWPWQVAVYQTVPDKRYICGGTLVSTRHVITAAYCVTTRLGELDKRSPEVYLGKHNLKDSGEKVQVGTIKNILLHPEHNATFFKRDLAILELRDPVTFSDWVQPACLWPDSDIKLKNIVEQTGTVVGWDFGDTVGELKLLELSVVSQETCIRSEPIFFVTYTSDSTYCAETRGCLTSGHGMVFQKDGSWYLRGVVSLALTGKDPQGSRCDHAHYTVYADVAQALPWIKDNIKENVLI